MFAAVVLPVSAQVYKWVDENGVTHYEERPPQGQKATEVPDRLATPDPASTATKRTEPDKAQADADKRRENCARQRELLAHLKQGSGPGARNPEREAALARQEQLVSGVCG